MTKTKHQYDNPDLMPREWMLAVMRDPTVPITTRIDVAAWIMKLDHESGNLFLDHPNDPSVPQVTIRIGGMPNDNPPELIEPEPKSKVH